MGPTQKKRIKMSKLRTIILQNSSKDKTSSEHKNCALKKQNYMGNITKIINNSFDTKIY
jgi:hypothetical protein